MIDCCKGFVKGIGWLVGWYMVRQIKILGFYLILVWREKELLKAQPRGEEEVNV